MNLFPEPPSDGRFFVVNIKHYTGSYVYCGRAGKGKTGPFGNRFTREEYGDRAIDLHAADFDLRVAGEPAFRTLLQEVLDGSVRALGCFCKKRDGTGRCHVDKIAAWLNERIRNGTRHKDVSV